MEEYQKIYEKVIFEDGYNPDPWQRKILEHEGNISIRTGRQVGKSVTVAKKASKLAVKYDNINILMIAASQRQSSLLFEKTMAELMRVHDILLKQHGGYKDDPRLSRRRNMEESKVFARKYGIFVETPTKTQMTLKNGTRIYSLPAGKTGMFIRGLTIDVMIPDEAAYIPEAVWVAVGPMLAVSQKTRGMGWEIILSTPFGKGGHFYDTQHDDDYLQIHFSSENCRRIPRAWLNKKKLSMSKLEYAQEILGEFVDEFNQMFSTKLIKDRMNFIGWDYNKQYSKNYSYYLGVDIARYGQDENAFVILESRPDKEVFIIGCHTTERKSTTDTIGRIKAFDAKYHFNKIFIDDAGVGGGVTDALIEFFSRSKIEAINNATKSIDKFARKGKILKEDLYSNALIMMERESKPINIRSDLKLLKSLKSMQFEYTADQNLKIFGKYSHLAEAFVRALWFEKSKRLRLFLA